MASPGETTFVGRLNPVLGSSRAPKDGRSIPPGAPYLNVGLIWVLPVGQIDVTQLSDAALASRRRFPCEGALNFEEHFCGPVQLSPGRLCSHHAAPTPRGNHPVSVSWVDWGIGVMRGVQFNPGFSRHPSCASPPISKIRRRSSQVQSWGCGDREVSIFPSGGAGRALRIGSFVI
jgi:hypothetical protein